jgi:hypothetical protein
MRNPIRAIFLALLLATLPVAANAELFVSVSFGPPALPVYLPPPIPAPGYIWTPGYWAWGGDEYYWVPGTWVLAPAVGLLWTPGYWGWGEGAYLWHAGYWGPHVGFYGGIDYGCGYSGFGYHGGYWQRNTFIVNNTVINEAPVNRVAFNGGQGGVAARPTSVEMRVAHEHHVGMSEVQLHHEQAAAHDRTMRASFNHGRPPVAATQTPGVFYGHGVVAARTGTAPAAMTGSPQGPHAPFAGGERGSAHTAAAGHLPQASRPMTHEQYGGQAGSAASPAHTATAGHLPQASRPMTHEQYGGHPGSAAPPARTAPAEHPPQAPRPMTHQQYARPVTHEQYGGHATSAPPARGAYPAGGGAPARPSSPSGGGHGGYDGGPRGAPANAPAQGHGGERQGHPAEHSGPG